MASPPPPANTLPRPEVGDLLLVIHAFEARGSDELSLSRGDRVELVERDDEFGDGWFMGRLLSNGNTGLFPELYTRPAKHALASSSAAPSPLAPLAENLSDKSRAIVDDHSQPAESPQTGPEGSPLTLPLMSNRTEASESRVIDPVATALGRLSNAVEPPQDSQVLNDTLNVINEHITNLRSPASNSALRTPAMDSGSEYSASIHHRMSYIHGEETDEEEHDSHTRAEVVAWSPDDVAEFLFTSGVEKQHCEVFRDQEISGEVLLGMDQSSLFIKDFDLGSVGRRLKTWHRIKALQDEVGDDGTHTRRTTQTYGSDIGSEDAGRSRVRTSTLNSVSNTNRRQSSNNAHPMLTPVSANGTFDSPTHLGHVKRPSAASIREMHHSRRHSSTDYRANTPRLSVNEIFTGAEGSHKKQPSFDRNWTLGAAGSRPLSQTGLRGVAGGPNDDGLQDSAVDLDRGYFSGTEVEERPRNLLRKRDSVAHSRKSSYADEQRIRSATAHTRHSRFGSDSYRDSAPQTAAQKYYGTQAVPHRRTASTNTTESLRPLPPAKDTHSPAVTRLEPTRGSQGPAPPAKDGDWFSSFAQKPKSKTGGFGIRAISDNLGLDRSKNSTSGDSKDQSLPSPARTGSSTPSGGPSLDLESPNPAQSPSMGGGPVSRNKGKKGKKETSAYTRGLLNITPKEAMQDADFSGWMRKKSSNLMTTWKPRFFVLKGRRLSYFYSEEDDSEKGLIDISFHRVLPADNEKLTGLHASITGVVAGQNKEKEGLEKGDDTMFIFKLMPPRAGLSRGVHFTKPTVHYFAVPNLKQGRLWMAALMKATIDRDDSQPITTTYQQKTISLAKAKQMRSRPPALMNLDEMAEEDQGATVPAATAPSNPKQDPEGLGVTGEALSAASNGLGDGGQNGDGAAVPSLQST